MIQEDKATGTRAFKFLRGPIFANVILADEINRTPPKTQAALLEAMQEHQVTVGGTRHRLAEPFFVLATQNPIEQEGTYPLPEAQLDRFMFNIRVDYPDEEEELQIVQAHDGRRAAIDRADAERRGNRHFAGGSSAACRSPIMSIRYALQFTRLTRKEKGDVPDFIRKYVSWGAGPRASQYLVLAAKARAVLHGRYFANCEDIRAVAPPVLRHRILTNFNAEAEGIKPDDLVDRLIATIPYDDYDESAGGKLPRSISIRRRWLSSTAWSCEPG